MTDWTLIDDIEPDPDARVELCVTPEGKDRYEGLYINRDRRFRWRWWRAIA